MVNYMDEILDLGGELRLLVERFGPAARVAFDGPAADCPVCRGEVDQLTLVLDLAGVEPAACRSCGVLLAA